MLRLRLLLLVVVAAAIHSAAAGCTGNAYEDICCNGQYCDSRDGCLRFQGNRVTGACLFPRSCFHGRVNTCFLAEKMTPTHSTPLTEHEHGEALKQFDLNGDGSHRPPQMLFRGASPDKSCVGDQFVQLGDIKLRTGCPATIKELGLEVESIVFGKYVAVHHGVNEARMKLNEIGFH